MLVCRCNVAVNKARKKWGRRSFCKYSLPVFNTSGTAEIETEEQETGYFVARKCRSFSCFALFGMPFPPFCVAISPILHRNLSCFASQSQPFYLAISAISPRKPTHIASLFACDCASFLFGLCNRLMVNNLQLGEYGAYLQPRSRRVLNARAMRKHL